jgi:prepilin-type N-terminal cleavage/methylation domain-containing protein
MKRRQGFTLMELLVVLLIIGILSTVALRTIDATRDRSLFDQTTKEMNQLVQAITGNPDMTYDGRRVDFGFFGDMGRLPNGLRELVHNEESDPNWHGPYVRRTFGGDTASYLLDGWGHPYTYNPTAGAIASLGNGKYPMTVRVADSLAQLYNNEISGTITDGENNPPGEKTGIMVTCTLSTGKLLRFKIPAPGGYYRFSLAPPDFDSVPIGTHRLVAEWAGEKLTRWVTVSPRSRTIVDFRFSKSFRNQLQMVGTPLLVDTTGFVIQVVNDGATDDTVHYIVFAQVTPAESCYMNILAIDGTMDPAYPRIPMSPAIGFNDTAYITGGVVVAPNMSDPVLFGFYDFCAVDSSAALKSNPSGRTFLFRFSDGSEITVKP